MTAAATEYRETLAIERAIKHNEVEREKWINRQLHLELEANENAELVGAVGEEDRRSCRSTTMPWPTGAEVLPRLGGTSVRRVLAGHVGLGRRIVSILASH
jgi:hypothetical protein